METRVYVYLLLQLFCFLFASFSDVFVWPTMNLYLYGMEKRGEVDIRGKEGRRKLQYLCHVWLICLNIVLLTALQSLFWTRESWIQGYIVCPILVFVYLFFVCLWFIAPSLTDTKHIWLQKRLGPNIIQRNSCLKFFCVFFVLFFEIGSAFVLEISNEYVNSIKFH